MPFFSRLTDIVTCNLTSLLAAASDPEAALAEVIREMEQGVAGAQRSMKTAGDNERRLRSEVEEQRRQSDAWVTEAKERLAAGDEAAARQSLQRKHELENLIAGLEMQLKAAMATREHLTTTFHALEARLADARRRQSGLAPSTSPAAGAGAAAVASSAHCIDDELAALKRELESGRR